MKVSIEKIGPAKATAYLRNVDNIRKANKRKIALFVRDMNSGLWENNGSAIRLIGDNLVDGQNRMHAIVQSETTQEFVVIQGVEGQYYLDLGEKRTMAQYLKHEGHTYPTILAAAVGNLCSLRYYIDHPLSAGRPEVSHSDRIAAFNKHQRQLKLFVPMCHNQRGLMWKAQVAAAMCLGTTPREFPEAKEQFVHYLATGEDMTKTDPVYLLRDLMLQDTRRQHVRLEQRQRLGLVAKAWNAHRNEESITSRLRFRSAGKNQERFPKVL